MEGFDTIAAIVPPEKLRDYLLSPVHPIGRYKLAFFHSLGYLQDHWEELERGIRLQLKTGVAGPPDLTEFGLKYSVLGFLAGPNGRSARVVTVWIILAGENQLRFVTAYPED